MSVSSPPHDAIDLMRSVPRFVPTILAGAASAVAVTLLATFALASVAPRYDSEASILLSGPKYRISFDPKFTTLDTFAVAAGNRTDEYRAIAMGATVRRAAGAQLKDIWPSGEVDSRAIDVRVRGPLITVVGTASSPDGAERIANSYATAVVNELDNAYGVSDQDQAALRAQLAQAVKDQSEAEAKLEDFIRSSKLQQLAAAVRERQATRETLLDQANNDLATRLSSYFRVSGELERLRRDAETLRGQVAAGGQSSAGALGQTVSLLQLQSRLSTVWSSVEQTVFESELERAKPLGAPPGASDAGAQGRLGDSRVESPKQSPVTVQLQVAVDNGDNSPRPPGLAEIDALIRSIDSRQTDVRQELSNVLQRPTTRPPTSVLAGLGSELADPRTHQFLDHLLAESQALQAQIQQETFQRDILTKNLELAKTARGTLASKLQEGSIATAANGGRALVVSPAVAPVTTSFPPPWSRSLPIATVLGGVLGMGVGLTRDAARRRGDIDSKLDRKSVGRGRTARNGYIRGSATADLHAQEAGLQSDG